MASTRKNVLFQGDNLDCINILRENREQFDLIYLDPPYNTGNVDLSYKDKQKKNDWIEFLNSRLEHSMSLLYETGCLLISIDDKRYGIVRNICDSLFEDKYVTTFIWHKKLGGGGDNKNIVEEHEYILCYAKDASKMKFNGVALTGKEKKAYKFNDNGNSYKLESLLLRGPNSSSEKRPNLCYGIEDPYGNLIFPREGKGAWRYEKSRYEKEKNQIIWKKTKKGYKPYTKQYLINSINKERRKKLRTILDKDYLVGQTSDGTAEVDDILGRGKFLFPKPISLLSFLIDAITHENAKVLDYFAGSGTTACAVLFLNKKDRGNRTFTLCTNNENNICQEVTIPRIKACINGYIGKISEKYMEGLGGSFEVINIENL